MFSAKRKADDDASPNKVRRDDGDGSGLQAFGGGRPAPCIGQEGDHSGMALAGRACSIQVPGRWRRCRQAPAQNRRCVRVQAAKMANGGSEVRKATFTRSLEALNSQFAT